MSKLQDYIPDVNNESSRGDVISNVSEADGCNGKKTEIGFFRELSPEYFRAVLADCPGCEFNEKCYKQAEARKILIIKPSNMKAWPDLPD